MFFSSGVRETLSHQFYENIVQFERYRWFTTSALLFFNFSRNLKHLHYHIPDFRCAPLALFNAPNSATSCFQRKAGFFADGYSRNPEVREAFSSQGQFHLPIKVVRDRFFSKSSIKCLGADRSFGRFQFAQKCCIMRHRESRWLLACIVIFMRKE